MFLPNRLTQMVFYRGIFLSIAIILFVNVNTNGQANRQTKFSKVKVEDFTLNLPIITANSNAAIIFDKGDVSFIGNDKGWFSYVFKRDKKIKIINNKGFDLATVQLLLYKDDDGNKEKIENLAGITYNNENGTITETKLDLKDVLEEKYDKNHFYKKFALPAVKEGSIIEYTYTVISDFAFNLPSWEFQSAECPTLWSEYNVAIPGLLSYMAVFQGLHKFDINKSGEGFKNYLITRHNANGVGNEERMSVNTQTTTHRWVMKDVPAFYAENYISSPANYIDKMSFQLYKTYDGEVFHDVSNNWKTVTDALMNRDDFGKPLNDDNYWLDKTLAPVTGDNDSSLETAKKIYYYIQKNYTCTNHDDKYITTSLRDVVKKKSGSVGDINLLLIAMLTYKKINAFPVLLSTSEFGLNSPAYPLMEKLNYVIDKINIGSVSYYLDATIPFLPFGSLPLNCYNGHARVISNDTAAVYFERSALKENPAISVFIFNGDSNQMDGAFTRNMAFFESLNARTDISKSGLDSYETNLKTSYPEDVVLSNIEIDSLEIPEAPVSLKFDFKLSAFENADIVYFNPFMGENLKENPFYATERVYPVEMPYTENNVYTLTMEIPKGYKVDELPKSARVKLNATEGSFEYLISADANNIQMRCILELKQANFAPEDYQTLRDFYTFIVKKEAEQIVFKKIK